MIISVAGKAGSGKDTVGTIIQYLTSNYFITGKSFKDFTEINTRRNDYPQYLKWQIKKFAFPIKKSLSEWLGVPIEKLEDREWREQPLGEEWWYWYDKVLNKISSGYLDDSYRIENHQWTLIKPTPRQLMVSLGTEAGRDHLHPNIWVNSLFSGYIAKKYSKGIDKYGSQTIIEEEPYWVITDMRFPNEYKEVKGRGGITIRVERKTKKTSKDWQDLYPKIKVLDPDGWNRDKRFDFEWNKEFITLEEYKFRVMRSTCKFKANFEDYFKEESHISETALDNVEFDYVVNNNQGISELIEKVKQILINEKIM